MNLEVITQVKIINPNFWIALFNFISFLLDSSFAQVVF